MLDKRFSRTGDTFLVIQFLKKRTFSTATALDASYPAAGLVFSISHDRRLFTG